MREISVWILLMLTAITQADECIDGSFIGSKEGICIDCACDNIGSINNTCDKQSGKCDCKDGFFGHSCNSHKCNTNPCYEIILQEFEKANEALRKLSTLKQEIDNNFNTTVLDSVKKELDNLKNLTEILRSNIKSSNPVDLTVLEDLDSHAKKLQKDIHDLTKMYDTNKDHQKLIDSLSERIKRIQTMTDTIDKLNKELQNIIKTANNQDKIEKISKVSTDMLSDIQNMTSNLDSTINYLNNTCLEIIDVVCTNNQTTELEKLKTEIASVDTKTIQDRISLIKENTTRNNNRNTETSQKIAEITFTKLPKFNSEIYGANHNNSVKINDLQVIIDSVDKQANDHLHRAGDALRKVNITKAKAYNKIIIAPHKEIQLNIDHILNSSEHKNRLDKIIANMTLADDKLKGIMFNLKSLLEQRDLLTLKIEENMHLPFRHEGEIKLLRLIKELKAKVLDVDKHYEHQLEYLRETQENMETEFKEIERLIQDDIRCMVKESENIDQELVRADEEMSKLDEELNRTEDALIILTETEEVANEIRQLESAIAELNEIQLNATTLCPVYDLNR